MITSLVFRSNLRLIPLLLLFLGYTRGMPHVLRFGKKLFDNVSVKKSNHFLFSVCHLEATFRKQDQIYTVLSSSFLVSY